MSPVTSRTRLSPDEVSAALQDLPNWSGDADGECLTCGDVAIPLTVVAVGGADARCRDDTGRGETVAIELVGPVRVGDEGSGIEFEPGRKCHYSVRIPRFVPASMPRGPGPPARPVQLDPQRLTAV